MTTLRTSPRQRATARKAASARTALDEAAAVSARQLRALYLTMTILASLLVGLVAGALANMDGASLPATFGVAGAAFIAAMTVILGALKYLSASAP